MSFSALPANFKAGDSDTIDLKNVPPSGIVLTDTLQKIISLSPDKPYYLDFYRLLNLDDILNLTRSIEGSIVEAGTGLGMSLAMFSILSEAIGVSRKIWSYDSFEGLPAPSTADLSSQESLAKEGDLYYGGIEGVLNTLRMVGLDTEVDQSIHLVKGWFEETMPLYNGPQVAVLHVDGDLYGSTMTTLQNFWPRLAVGGIVIFDEYDNETEWPGEKRAADEFFSRFPGKVRMFRDRFGIRWNAMKLT